MDTQKLKKVIIKWLPYVIFGYAGDIMGYAYRISEGDGFSEKLSPFIDNLSVAFSRIIPSFHQFDLGVGVALAAVMKLVI